MVHNAEIPDPAEHWYVVWTRSRQEKAAAAMLDTLGIDHYLPLKSELRQWSDRKQLVKVPLFSGYLFVCMNLSNVGKHQVLNIPGVVAFVGNQNGPSPIPEKQIEDIRRVLAAGIECSVQPLFNEGDTVRVIRGPLTGVEGMLARSNSNCRLMISIQLIHQSLSVNVLREDVELVATTNLNNVTASARRTPKSLSKHS